MLKPILSICIPTFNRGNYLDETLETIVSQEIFRTTDKIEIVISDNASTDNTYSIVKNYIDIYKHKIRYYRLKQHVCSSENFFNVISFANGIYKKLHNDTLHILPDSLSIILNIVESHIYDRHILFFSNESIVKKREECINLTEFIDELSYFNTWIGGFGFWDSDKNISNLFITKKDTRLAQTYILCKLLSNGRKCNICNEKLFKSICPKNKGASNNDAYNTAEVFGYNYLTILKEFVFNGFLSNIVYKHEKKKVLLEHINSIYFDIKERFKFEKTGYFKWLIPYYKWDLYFYIAYLKKIIFILVYKIYYVIHKLFYFDITNR